MRFVIAPDSFKESMSALCAAQAISRGLHRGLPDAVCDLVPMADGGEGTAECLLAAKGGERVPCRVTGPLGQKENAWLLWYPESRTALIEVAMACGLTLIKAEERDPMAASSFGVGEMINAALKLGCEKLLLSLGGTGTNDGGLGLLQALGAEILDKEGKPVGRGGGALTEAQKIDLSPAQKKLENIQLTALCDVRNPLLGREGATYVFGPQKGANERTLPLLEEGMRRFSQKIELSVGEKLSEYPGAGAAGGIGFALYALGKAQFARGSKYLMEASGLEERIRMCDCVITGEGSVDAQSLNGKAPIEISRLAKKYGKPVIVFAGRISKNADAIYEQGVTALFGIVRAAAPLRKLFDEGEKNLEFAAENLSRLLKAFFESREKTV